MFRMEREELQAIVRELDQAIYHHNQWYQDIIRSITCRLPFDKRDMDEAAHHHCPFGQWYYRVDDEDLQENKTFQSIRSEHKMIHTVARELLQSSAHSESISPMAFDRFSGTIERLRLNLNTLKYELEETLYKRDPLTGARNRVSMLSDLRKQMTLIDRLAETTTIALMDVDHFKQINDRYGHPVGDKVLSGIASYIIQNLRPYDNLYRYGGEEFLLMMPHTNLDTSMAIVERLRVGIESNAPACSQGEEINVTASFGITQLEAHLDVELAIENADKALYEAKNSGRNRSIIYTV